MRYRFMHRDDSGQYHWESVEPLPGDSRHDHITCDARWFWRPVEPTKTESADAALRRQLAVWRAEHAKTGEPAALARVRILAGKIENQKLSFQS